MFSAALFSLHDLLDNDGFDLLKQAVEQ